jgi:hypothetical protein
VSDAETFSLTVSLSLTVAIGGLKPETFIIPTSFSIQRMSLASQITKNEGRPWTVNLWPEREEGEERSRSTTSESGEDSDGIGVGLVSESNIVILDPAQLMSVGGEKKKRRQTKTNVNERGQTERREESEQYNT